MILKFFTSSQFFIGYSRFKFHKTNLLSVKNYYKTLGVHNRATEADIKKSFFKLAKIYHPDHNKSPGAKDKFTEILEAYDILSDEKKRKVYDKSGLNSSEVDDMEFEEIDNVQPGYYKEEVDMIEEDDNLIKDEEFEKLYKKIKDFYGPLPYNKRNLHIQDENRFDINIELNLNFMESIEGCAKNVFFNRYILCENCNAESCDKCYGKGYKTVYSSEKVDIPKALEIKKDGNIYIKLKGKGHEYKFKNKKYNSDLYVKVKVNEHEYFSRDGNNIITTNYVTVSQYLLGATIKVLTIHGVKEINIKPYTEKLEIQNYGVNKTGTHIVNIQIRLPTKLTDEHRKIFNEIKKYEY